MDPQMGQISGAFHLRYLRHLRMDHCRFPATRAARLPSPGHAEEAACDLDELLA